MIRVGALIATLRPGPYNRGEVYAVRFAAARKPHAFIRRANGTRHKMIGANALLFHQKTLAIRFEFRQH